MFRVKFTDPDGTWWTEPIRNWADVCRFLAWKRLQGIGADAFSDTRSLAREVASHLANARAEQQRTGQPQFGQIEIRCDCGRCQPIAVRFVRVPQPACCGDAGPPATITVLIAGEEQEELPRDLAGPLPEEVAQHTPAPTSPEPRIMAYDHGGGRRKEKVTAEDAKSAKDTKSLRPSAASAVGFLDRFIAWLTGAPRGIEVRP